MAERVVIIDEMDSAELAEYERDLHYTFHRCNLCDVGMAFEILFLLQYVQRRRKEMQRVRNSH